MATAEVPQATLTHRSGRWKIKVALVLMAVLALGVLLALRFGRHKSVSVSANSPDQPAHHPCRRGATR